MVLVLALDTATPAVTAGVVELAPRSVTTRAVRVTLDARKHGELLLPGLLAACADAGVELGDVDAIVVGTGPGPFTGLRVGMVTAAALGDALDVPVHGVCSLDAIAAEAVEGSALDGPLLVVPGAASAAPGARTTGPHVEAPAALADRLPVLGVTAAAGAGSEGLGLPVVGPTAPGPAGLVACAAEALRAEAPPAPLEPLYLRRPDAVAPGPRKPVTARRG